ncbi:MAG: DUF2851 family protein [Chitinophagales bacterium]|nr:DUF2851 family protein [Chitinophagales bacterium]
MNEQLLRFVWKFRLFNTESLTTTSGEKVQLVHQGIANSDAGPDFQNAKIRIGETLWAGNVELHIKSSDWFLHHHQRDAAYNNVILHVVFKDDGKQAVRENGEPIPVLKLEGRINRTTLTRYEQLANRKKQIHCADFFPEAAEDITNSFLSGLLVERLERKVQRINEMLTESKGDWEHVMFRLIARYLGAGVNREPMELLAKSLPLTVYAKYSDEPMQTEALLLGQAGLLDQNFDDDYAAQLRKEYLYLKRLHQLEPLPRHVWKLLRLRPANFPDIRIAQLASLLIKHKHLFSAARNCFNVKSVHRLFETEVSEYWKTHYLLDKKSARVKYNIGTSTKNVLLINAVAPVLFAYGKYKDEDKYCEQSMELLETCQPENNALLTYWKSHSVQAKNAFDTQALIQLRTAYCENFRCLECRVGLQLLK